jgi:hypothetical protein
MASAQLGAPDVELTTSEWPDALAGAVRARSRSGIATRLRAAVAARS